MKEEKKHPKVAYTDLRFYVDAKAHPWIKDCRDAFKLLDKEHQFPMIILVATDDYLYKDSVLTFKGLKRIWMLDKGSNEFDDMF